MSLRVVETESELSVYQRQYWIVVLFVCAMILSLVGSLDAILDRTIKPFEVFGLAITVIIAVLCLHYFVEFGKFIFSNSQGEITWKRSGFFHKDSGNISYKKIARIRRDALENSRMLGWQNTYRLVVITKENEAIPLSKSFIGQNDKKIDDVVNKIR